MSIELPNARQLSADALQVLRLRALRGLELAYSDAGAIVTKSIKVYAGDEAPLFELHLEKGSREGGHDEPSIETSRGTLDLGGRVLCCRRRTAVATRHRCESAGRGT